MRWPGFLLLIVAVAALSTTATAKSSNPAFLGVQMDDIGGARGVGPCMVTTITKDSGAEAAGLRSGDVFVTLDAKPVANCDGLVSMIQAREPGDHVRLDVRRTGAQVVSVKARLLSRDEVLRRRFGNQPAPVTQLVRLDDRSTVDLSVTRRATTIIGWYPTTCVGCEAVFGKVARWSRDNSKGMPIAVAAATAGDLRSRRSIEDNLEALKPYQRGLDVPLLVADAETYEHFAIGDGDRIQFMVIDCRGIVQYAAPVVPSSEDADAILDELYAAAEQAARRVK